MDGGATAYLAWASLAATAVSAGVSYAQSQQASAARSQAAMYNAAVAKNNEKIAASYADMAVQRGQALEEEKRRETAQRQGAIRAFAGASGVDANSGSPLRLADDTAHLGELDAQTIRANSQKEAFGYRTRGMDYAAQAQLDEMAANDASNAGELGAWSSLVGGASQTSDKWLKFRTSGVPGFKSKDPGNG